jgi:hypothetical protein
LSSALGISKNEIRRALLRDLIAEARLRREQWWASDKEQSERDEIAELGAAMLAHSLERNEMVDDLLESGVPMTCLPTPDFGPGSEFVPDWTVDSGSDNEQTHDAVGEAAESHRPTSSSTENERPNVCTPGLPLSRMPVGWGGSLPGIAVGPKAATMEEPSSTCIASMESGTSDNAIDSNKQQREAAPARMQGPTDFSNPELHRSSQQSVEATPTPSDQRAKPWVVFNCAGRECGHYDRCWPPLAHSYDDMVRMRLWCQSAKKPVGNVEDVVERLRDSGVAGNLMSPILTSFVGHVGNQSADPRNCTTSESGIVSNCGSLNLLRWRVRTRLHPRSILILGQITDAAFIPQTFMCCRVFCTRDCIPENILEKVAFVECIVMR